jgi:hypothetical protein
MRIRGTEDCGLAGEWRRKVRKSCAAARHLTAGGNQTVANLGVLIEDGAKRIGNVEIRPNVARHRQLLIVKTVSLATDAAA